MVEKMMRLAGRDEKGLAKAIKTNKQGELVVKGKNTDTQMYIGSFVEPYEAGYVGNVAVSGLKVYGNPVLRSNIVDVKAGKSAIYIASSTVVEKISESFDESESVWAYANFMSDHTGLVNLKITNIMIDKNDDVIIIGTHDSGHRLIEKISGVTGLKIWGSNYNNSNYIHITDSFVDRNGHVYTIGSSGSVDSSKGGLLRKQSGVDGSLLWELKYVNQDQTGAWYMTMDSEGYIYISTMYGILKFDPTAANVSQAPVLVWTYTKRHTDAYGTNMYINVTLDGHIYRIEQTYNLNSDGKRGYRIVKIDQSTANSTTEPVEKWYIDYAIEEPLGMILLDSENYIYTKNGKINSEKKNVWGGATPFVITDIREDFLYGFKKIKSHYGSTEYRILKTGIDLKHKTIMGVK